MVDKMGERGETPSCQPGRMDLPPSNEQQSFPTERIVDDLRAPKAPRRVIGSMALLFSFMYRATTRGPPP